MASFTFGDEQLNFFKFAAVVFDEFPRALRQVFISMWDNKYGGRPGYQPWDDSVTVRKMFERMETSSRNHPPTNLSVHEWDCTALFQALIYSQSFAVRDSSGTERPLSKVYVDPKGVASGTFHTSVTGVNTDETNALAIDQLRRLRNILCHQASTKKMDKASFDHYIQLAKDSFTALSVATSGIDDISDLAEQDFPTTRVKALEESLLHVFCRLLEELTNAQESTSDEIREMRQDVTVVRDTIQKLRDSIESDLPESKQPNKMTKKEEGMHRTCTMNLTFLPSKRRYFTGRDQEKSDILNHLHIKRTRVVSLWGPPGFGKTSIAVEVGHILKEQGSNVLYVSLKNIDNVKDFVSNLRERLLASCQQSSSDVASSSKPDLCDRLSRLDRPTTLIFDNCDDLLSNCATDIIESFDTILESNSLVKVLCTSREKITSRNLCPCSLRIERLQTTDSRTLLHELVGSIPEQECEQLVAKCKHVPLAIHLVASMICENGVHPERLLFELTDRNILESAGNTDEHNLNELIEYSYQHLSQSQKQQFINLSVFPSSFDEEAAHAVLGTSSVSEAQNDLGVLVKKSLVEKDNTAETYALHDFMKEFCQLREISHRDNALCTIEARTNFVCYYLSKLEELNEMFLTSDTRSAVTSFRKDRENIICSLNEALKSEDLIDRAGEVLCEMDIFMDKVYWSNETEIAEMYEKYINAFVDKGNNLFCSNILVTSAYGYLHYHSDSNKLLRRANNFRKALANVPPNAHGKYLCYQGFRSIFENRVKKGIQLLREGIPLLGDSPLHTVIKVLALQVVTDYYKAHNQPSMAEQSSNDVLTSCAGNPCLHSFMQYLSDDGSDEIPSSHCHPLNTQIIYFLASISVNVESTDKYSKALKAFHGIPENMHDNEEIADSFYQLGLAFSRMKIYPDALDAHMKALEIRLKLYSEDHVDIAKSYYWIGHVNHDLGKYTDAMGASRRALDIQTNLVGDHRDTLKSLKLLTKTYRKLGDRRNALKTEQSAVQMDTRLKSRNVVL